MVEREGYPYIIGAAALAAAVFAVALRQRSWTLWLIAFALVLLTLGVAWSYRSTLPTA
jgi:hypothetical protein